MCDSDIKQQSSLHLRFPSTPYVFPPILQQKPPVCGLSEFRSLPHPFSPRLHLVSLSTDSRRPYSRASVEQRYAIASRDIFLKYENPSDHSPSPKRVFFFLAPAGNNDHAGSFATCRVSVSPVADRVSRRKVTHVFFTMYSRSRVLVRQSSSAVVRFRKTLL